MGSKAVSIHAHFYQPSREDPNTGIVPVEESAAPYRNWNERIHDHCYRPNADMGNFERVSFDLGPTLINWMISFDPVTFSKIVQQERKNFERYGVGNGMAQPYHHTILPLASPQDKRIQIAWGIADFEHRFGHKPAGLWLPEAAVDMDTLELLCDAGIQFTILAPWQADGPVVPGIPYRVVVPDGREIVVFFYNEDLSMRISFDAAATSNADLFVRDYLQPAFIPSEDKEQRDLLQIIASDGELYGHHQAFRDKFLSRLTLNHHPIVGDPIVFTYPGLWLQQHPAVETIQIKPDTSWSCHHGVARWAQTCPCTPEGDWKGPLRKAMDQISRSLDETYLSALEPFTSAPWDLLVNYIQVLHGKTSVKSLLQKNLEKKTPTPDEVTSLDYLLRGQYNKQRMFTSCGWFFEDFDRLEPKKNVMYAAQAVWWTWKATGVNLIDDARNHFSSVRSWRTGLKAEVIFAWQIDRTRYEQLAFPFAQTDGVAIP